MRVAVLSDIHGNREALEAVLKALERERIARVLCLGDLVGYNADPEWCLDKVLALTDEVIRGNHDKAAVGLMSLDYFNPWAREAALWTGKNLSESGRQRLARLAAGPRRVGELLMVHGSPRDEDEYILERETIRSSFSAMGELDPKVRICFFGHTHVPVLIPENGRPAAPQGEARLEEDRRYLINPGSVGQPRDGVAEASFGIFDGEKGTYRALRVPYPLRETQRKILEAGLPPMLAQRLEMGR